MGEQNNIEDKLRDSLNSREFVIKEAWQKDMDAQLDAFNSGKKKGILWWLVGFGVLLTAIGLSVVFTNSTEDNSVLNAEVTERHYETASEPSDSKKTPDSSNEIPSGSNTDDKASSNTDSISVDFNKNQENSSRDGAFLREFNDQNSSDKSIGNAKTGIEQLGESISGSTNAKRNKELNSYTEWNDNLKEDESPSLKNVSDNEAIGTEEDSEEATKTESDPYEKNSREISDDKNKNKVDNSNTNSNSDKNSSNPKDNDSRNNSKLITDTEKRNNLTMEDERNKTKKNSSFEKENSYSLLERINSKLGVLPGTAKNLADIHTDPITEEPSILKKHNWEFSLSLGTGTSSLKKENLTLINSGYPEKIGLSNLRSIQTDLRITRNLNSNAGISSGLSLTSYGEKLSYPDHDIYTDSTYLEYFQVEELQIDSIFDVNDSLISVDSTFIMVMDSMEVSEINKQTIIAPEGADGKKKITYLEIPIGFSYKIPLSKVSTLYIEPELAVGILTKKTGSYLNFDKAEETARSILLNGSLGVAYSRLISERLYIKGMGRIRKPLGNLNENNSLKREYTHLSFTVGLGYKF